MSYHFGVVGSCSTSLDIFFPILTGRLYIIPYIIKCVVFPFPWTVIFPGLDLLFDMELSYLSYVDRAHPRQPEKLREQGISDDGLPVDRHGGHRCASRSEWSCSLQVSYWGHDLMKWDQLLNLDLNSPSIFWRFHDHGIQRKICNLTYFAQCYIFCLITP